PEVFNLIQERIVTSRSKLSNQHQGHDAILEEINRALKSLIPLIPSQHIGKLQHYSESETQEPRTRPGFTDESSCYRAQIRKTQFINPKANNHVFQVISGEQKISEEMK
ncbi:10007_t:CDS:2, partial [Racocetra persica]